MRLTGLERDFGGEIRKFDLSPIGAWKALELNCGPIGKVWAHLSTAIAQSPDGKFSREELSRFECSAQEVREPLLQGLKGAGMPDADASKLMRTHYDTADGKLQFALLAFEIVSAFWLGLPEGKTTAPETNSEA